MSEKLTAKLSDGTEWEVVEKWTADGPGCVRCSLKPLKPSPPKEVFLCVYSDGSVSATYLTAEDASKYALGLSAPYPVHRYTLAPEETAREKNIRLAKEVFNVDNAILKAIKKPAREWWDVRYIQGGGPYCSYKSEGQAKAWCETENGYLVRAGMPARYEVVHVREVVSE